MKAVVAIDSLKGSLSSVEAGNAIAEGIRRADAQAEVVVRPLADGGEGTVDALVPGMNGSLQQVQVTGPQRTMAESECYRHLGMSFWTARGIRFLTVLLAWKILRKLRAKT